jgi:hypothetical protein
MESILELLYRDSELFVITHWERKEARMIGNKRFVRAFPATGNHNPT